MEIRLTDDQEHDITSENSELSQNNLILSKENIFFSGQRENSFDIDFRFKDPVCQLAGENFKSSQDSN